MTLLQANALRIPLADESVPKMWYNSDCLNEQNTGAFCFLAAAFSQSEIVGKVPSTWTSVLGCSFRQRQRTRRALCYAR